MFKYKMVKRKIILSAYGSTPEYAQNEVDRLLRVLEYPVGDCGIEVDPELYEEEFIHPEIGDE